MIESEIEIKAKRYCTDCGLGWSEKLKWNWDMKISQLKMSKTCNACEVLEEDEDDCQCSDPGCPCTGNKIGTP